MDETDRFLREVGERWRSWQAPPPDVDIRRLAPTGRRWHWLLVPVGAATVAVSVGLAAWAIWQHGPATGPGSVGSALGALLEVQVRPGEHVAAHGQIVKAGESGPTICRVLPPPDVGYEDPAAAPAPVCSSFTVPVLGVVFESLPGWSVRGNTGFSAELIVRGTWTGSAIDVAQVLEPGAAPTHVWPPVPCEEPVGGWPSTAGGPLEVEASLSALGDEIAANPDLYVGSWRAGSVDPSGGDETIIVVGTTVSPEEVRVKLRRLYPYALCITKVDYNATQLRNVATALSEVEASWAVSLRPELSRVQVDVVVLDARAVDRLAPFAASIVVEPFVGRDQ